MEMRTVKLYRDGQPPLVRLPPILVNVPWQGGSGPGLLQYQGDFYATTGCCGMQDEYFQVDLFQVEDPSSPTEEPGPSPDELSSSASR